MDQLLRFWSDGHTLYTKLLRLHAPSVMTSRDAPDSLWNRHRRVLRPKLSKTSSWVVLRLNHEIAASSAPHACSPLPGHVSHQSSTKSVTRYALPRPRTSSCPRCQPPWLVTRLFRSLGQVLALVLHHSQSIGTNPHDLHLHRWPPYMCSTPAHHKPRDMVRQHITHTLVSPPTTPKYYPFTTTHHQHEPQGTNQLGVQKGS
jgi:hypothetical protein